MKPLYTGQQYVHQHETIDTTVPLPYGVFQPGANDSNYSYTVYIVPLI